MAHQTLTSSRSRHNGSQVWYSLARMCTIALSDGSHSVQSNSSCPALSPDSDGLMAQSLQVSCIVVGAIACCSGESAMRPCRRAPRGSETPNAATSASPLSVTMARHMGTYPSFWAIWLVSSGQVSSYCFGKWVKQPIFASEAASSHSLCSWSWFERGWSCSWSGYGWVECDYHLVYASVLIQSPSSLTTGFSSVSRSGCFFQPQSLQLWHCWDAFGRCPQWDFCWETLGSPFTWHSLLSSCDYCIALAVV